MNCAGVAPSIANISTWVPAGEGGGTGLNCFSPPVLTVCVTNVHAEGSRTNAAIVANRGMRCFRDIETILPRAGLLCNQTIAPHVLLIADLNNLAIIH